MFDVVLETDFEFIEIKIVKKMKKFVVVKNSKMCPNNQDVQNQFTTQVKMSGYLKKKRNVSVDKCNFSFE